MPSSRLAGIRAITFDATGTLLRPRDLGGTYSRVLDRHGVAVAPEEAARLVHRVWEELECSSRPDRDRFASHPGGERGWWRRFAERFGEHLGQPVGPFAAAELFEGFARGAEWELFPEVPGVLDALTASGRPLAVVANWDSRLPRVLAELGIAERFEAVVTSSSAGVEKPHPAIFERALTALGQPAAKVLHVGDRRRHDTEGAVAAGLRALHLDRSGGGGDLTDLSALAGLLAGPGGAAGRGPGGVR